MALQGQALGRAASGDEGWEVEAAWGRKETSPCPTRGVCGVGRGQRKKVHSQLLRDGLSPPSGHPPLVGSEGAQEIRVLSPYLLHENPAMCPGARTGQWWQMTLGKSLESVITSHS